MKFNEIPIGTKVNLFDREGWDTEEAVVLEIKENGIVFGYKNKSRKGKYFIPFTSILSRSINIYIKKNDLNGYEIE